MRASLATKFSSPSSHPLVTANAIDIISQCCGNSGFHDELVGNIVNEGEGEVERMIKVAEGGGGGHGILMDALRELKESLGWWKYGVRELS